MGLNDLLGLLFLFFFIVLPALQGLLRRGQQMPPDFEPEEIPLPQERRPPQRPPSTQPPPPGASTTSAPPSPPPASAPPTRPLVSQPAQPPKHRTPPKRPLSLEEIERERLARSSARQTKEPPPIAASREVELKARPAAAPRVFSTSTHDILSGVVWLQVLAEPRSRYWKRARKSRR